MMVVDFRNRIVTLSIRDSLRVAVPPVFPRGVGTDTRRLHS